MASLTPQSLFTQYRDELTTAIAVIQTQGKAGIPVLVAQILVQIVPSMMSDVGKITSLSGAEKKQLIIDTLSLAITEGFAELNKDPVFAATQVDEMVRDLLLKLVAPLIDTFVKIEDGHLVFNKTPSCCGGFFSRFACCK
jgi:hypothetical protein